MAGTSLLALLDDITSALDDIALLTKVAAQKTAGVLGDDLALNAEQVSGVRAERELPVVWAVAKGSAVNKLILVPVAIAISALAPWLVTPLLMCGGAFLCFEGCEKLLESWLHGADTQAQRELQSALTDPAIDLVALEKQKIRGAIRTDFVLSAEIVTISLGSVAEAEFITRVTVLSLVSAVMTVGVYGIVAAIVKLDDVGLFLTRRPGRGLFHAIGFVLLRATPVLMRLLSVAGTIAMFMVGGGILTHGIAPLHHAIEGLGERCARVSVVGPLLRALVPALCNVGVGVAGGMLVVGVLSLLQRLRGKPAH